jgi:hypothetical protein
MPTDAPDGLINQHVVTSVKARKTAKKAAADKAPDDDTAAASKSDKG